ncbi:methylisocitrate lyase [Sphingomonas sp. CL5.1]|uniref:methylisocitrate lyase n=1 Tax=Sphingomonas sp. CL5.1 TaxID=2653203 RepID=UPI001582D96C|nr:methylisocitrate lyase [Sphingomonas sp. CL5.1]QKS00280.1 methylisocitrate lyase [Sphingomonas sp. CL5.1]
MVSLVAADRSTIPAGQRFRALLEQPDILRMPGVYNGLSAIQARRAGFEALYLSGAAVSAAMGLPDLGTTTIDDLCFHIRQCFHAADLPMLVDGDTGFGGALNAMHMVRRFEEAGAGAVQIEDQILPKKCGHLSDKKLADAHEMAAKIAAAARARRNMVIVARTDAVAQEGLEAAIDRANLYRAAGADAIFPEALHDAEMFSTFATRVQAPLLANMTEFGKTPFFTADEFAEMGFRMVIWPVSALRVAARAQESLYATLAQDGSAAAQLNAMQTRAELYETLGYGEYEELDASIERSTLPS